MDTEIHNKNLKMLLFQRNFLLGLITLLSLSITATSVFLFTKTERIIVVPPFEKEFWMDKGSVSATYLEQFGYFLGQLLLAKSSNSAPEQRKIVLRHTDPLFITTLNNRLQEEEKMLMQQNASYVFYPIDVHVNPKSLEVKLTGDRSVYINEKSISTEREIYVLNFSYNGSRLFLKGLSNEEIKK